MIQRTQQIQIAVNFQQTYLQTQSTPSESQILERNSTGQTQLLTFAEKRSLYQELSERQQYNSKIINKPWQNQKIRTFRSNTINRLAAYSKISGKIFFDFVCILDRISDITQNCQKSIDFSLTAAVCLMISTKMNHLTCLRVSKHFSRFLQAGYSKSAIIEIQENIIKKLDYKLIFWSFFDLAIMKLSEFCKIQHQSKDNENIEDSFDELYTQTRERILSMEKICRFICLFVVVQHQILCQNSAIELAQACAAITLDVLEVQLIPEHIYTTSSANRTALKDTIFEHMVRFKEKYPHYKAIFQITPKDIQAQLASYLQKY